ncbi:MAG: NUDIX hydrolase [Candidatus Diapherotrites archaeon]|nr:NUDIX hydrolase [Candidatus Diapherotrites archaeon]
MGIPKTGVSKKGLAMHYSVGALIRKGARYLLIDRVKPPYGYAGIAGHVDEGETPEQALVRETKEESGLEVRKFNLLYDEELDWNYCSKGITAHQWYFYECKTEGKVRRDSKEAKQIGWFAKKELENLALEPVWTYWFQKQGLIKKRTRG